MKISKESFHRWKDDPVTKELMRKVTLLKTNINLSLLNSNMILEDRKHSSRLLGQREGLETLLYITADDLIEEEKDDEVTSSGT